MDGDSADMNRAVASQDLLPAEIMCAILRQLDYGWWPLAAQTCSWWRACAAAATTISTPTFATVGTPTLTLAVRGGYVNVILWMEQTSGRSYAHARDMAQWMASAPRCHSWGDIIAAAARNGHDDVLVWASERLCDVAAVDADPTCARRIPGDVVMMAAIGYRRWQKIEDLCTSGQPARRAQALRTLHRFMALTAECDPRIVACILVSGNPDLTGILCSAGCMIDSSTLLLAAVCTDDHVFRRLLKRHRTHWSMRSFVVEATWLADQRLLPARGSAVRLNSPAVGEHDASGVGRPLLRAPHANDFLPGGALERYVLDGYLTFRQALAALLWPLCVGPDCTEGDLDAWIESVVCKFDSWYASRAAARRQTYTLIHPGRATCDADFGGDKQPIRPS